MDFLNKIFNEDCLQTMSRMPDKSIDLVVTSPPYNIGIDYDNYNDNVDWVEYYLWCEKWIKELQRVIKDDGRICINHYLSCGQSANRHAPLMKINEMAMNVGLKHHGLAVWEDITLTKRTAWGSWLSASAPYVNSPYEGVLILYKDRWKKDKAGTTQITDKEFMESCSGVWKIHPEHKRDGHPAKFPLRLAERCILLLSYEGDIVYDPFMGSGTTAKASKKWNRIYVGSELSDKYSRLSETNVSQENLF